MRTSYRTVCLLAFGLTAFSNVALADSVAPATFTDELNTGESVTVHKVVTIDTAPPTDALVDVFLLTDSTGSMGGAIAAVKSSALSIVSTTASLGNVRFGAGEYKDVGDTFVYRTNTDLTNVPATVQAGINAWFASGGGDLPEANIYGLQQVANTISWRPGSTRILVWFGDAPSHDPSNGATEVSATATLVSHGIAVQALNLSALDSSGQATRITNATHGHLYNGVSTSSIVSTIQASITTSLLTYSTVDLDLSLVPAGVTATKTSGYSGTYARDIVRTFAFDVTFTGVTPGTYPFEIPVLVDTGKVATESDNIKVVTGGGSTGPTPPACALTAIVAGPPKQLQITVQDPDNGLQSVEVVISNNTTIAIPSFAVGEKGALLVTATKVDQSAGAQVELKVTDVNGTVTHCDPIVPGDLESMDESNSENGLACTVGHLGGKAGVSGLLVGALAGLALLRRRRSSTPHAGK